MDTPFFECPKCGAKSYNANDIANGYCGRCHEFTREQVNQVAERISPFLWIDKNGCGHVNIPDLLKYSNIADTPENHAIAKELAKEAFNAVFKDDPQAHLRFRMDQSFPGEEIK